MSRTRKPSNPPAAPVVPKAAAVKISDTVIARSKGQVVKASAVERPFDPHDMLHPPGAGPKGSESDCRGEINNML